MSVDLFLGLGVGALAAVVVMMVLDAYRLLSRFPEESEKTFASSSPVNLTADESGYDETQPMLCVAVVDCDVGKMLTAWVALPAPEERKSVLLAVHRTGTSEEALRALARERFEAWKRGEL